MTPSNKRLELSKEEMQQFGYKIVDEIVSHFDTQESKSPIVSATRTEMDDLFHEPVPMDPKDPNEVLDYVVNNALPYCNITSHPKSYSFVPGPSNYVSVMADALATGYNIFSGGWVASPAASAIEITTINWLLKIFGFPAKRGGGLFTSGGSMANLTALVTARRHRCREDFSKAVIYMSDQAHSSNIKAIRVIGFRKDQVRIIPTDSEYKVGMNKLKNAIARDRLAGLKPFCLIASAGTTNTGTVDPLDEMGKLCAKEDIWFHIDGAYGGAAILSKNGKQLLKGIQRADSLTVDPHKWFYQPYEMGCLLVRNHKWLTQAFAEKPEYLRDVEGNTSEINFYDHGIQLTRRFRALKFYMSVKTFGLQAFKDAVDYCLDLAEQAEEVLRVSPHWEVVSHATLGVVNFRYNPMALHLTEKQLDAINQKISKQIIANGDALLVTTVLNGQVVLRMCLINPRTTLEHIGETLDQCHAIGSKITQA